MLRVRVRVRVRDKDFPPSYGPSISYLSRVVLGLFCSIGLKIGLSSIGFKIGFLWSNRT